MNISAYMCIFINLAKSTEKKKTINVVEDCSHCDLRRIENGSHLFKAMGHEKD